MIKVLVVVSGLVLVQPATKDGPTTIHFLETGGFATPEAGFAMDAHASSGTLFKVAFSPKSQYQLEVQAPKGGSNVLNLDEAKWHPGLTNLYRKAQIAVRPECEFKVPAVGVKGSLETCVAAGQKLLVGQLQLKGTWKLRALDTLGTGGAPGRDPLASVQRFRTLTVDPAYSQSHPFAGRQFANTFAFETVVKDLSDVGFVRDGKAVTLTNSDLSSKSICQGYDSTFPDCALLRIDHSRDCLMGGCSPSPPAWADTDTHFAQIYRLTALYDDSTGSFRDDLFVPFGPVHVGGAHGAGGPSGPRCYGGMISP